MTFGTKVTEILRVPLTESELVRKGDELARYVLETECVDKDRMATAKRFADLLRERKLVTEGYLRDITTQSEDRPVETYEVPRYSEQLVDIYRCDTNQVHRTRNMQPAERQQGLFEEQRQERMYGDDEDETPGTKH